MLNSGRILDLPARGQSNVTSAERRGVFGDLWLSCFLQSGEEESKCGWCIVLSFASLSLSQSWSSSLLVVCLLLICSAVEKFVFYIVFIFWLDQIGFSLFFTAKVMDWPKNYIYLFLFFDKFHWCFAMHWSYVQKPLFSILKKVSALITSGECSCGR